MRDQSKRCMHCAHYDGYDMKCKAHPPAYAGETQDFDGDTAPYYSQPVIEYAWAETCGEWQAGQPEKTADERMAEIRLAANLDKQTDPASPEVR